MWSHRFQKNKTKHHDNPAWIFCVKHFISFLNNESVALQVLSYLVRVYLLLCFFWVYVGTRNHQIEQFSYYIMAQLSYSMKYVHFLLVWYFIYIIWRVFFPIRFVKGTVSISHCSLNQSFRLQPPFSTSRYIGTIIPKYLSLVWLLIIMTGNF